MSIGGAKILTDDTGVTVHLADVSNYALFCSGTVATSALDAATTYQKGCIYAKTDVATTSSALYENTGTLAAPVWTLVGAEMMTGDTNVIGNDTKTSYNKLTGYTKIDYRPTGGGTNSYAFQIRHNVGNTSGSVISLDYEAHITADGTASLRGVQGVAVVDTGFTNTDGTLIGSYGQVRADGTVTGSGFMAGMYALVEASAAITASHVCSAWLDSHQANAVTGSHQLLYMTNNGAATMDEAIYIYGGNKISNLMELNTVTGMTNAANGSGSDVYINFTIDGVAARIAAKYVA